MADANVTEQVVLSNTGEQRERVSIDDKEVCDPIPPSLLSYFEASKSRAADCEKFIREELEDEAGADERTQCFTIEVQSLEPAMNENHGKNMSGCELEKTQEQSRRREREFQEELRRLTEAEKLQQLELQLMAKKAQEKLEHQCLLQQVLMYNLKKRVEQERKMRDEEQKKMKEEQQMRKKMKEEKRNKENEERRKREEEKKKRKNEEAMRRQREDEARRKGKMRNKDEEKRKTEEEERREAEEKEQREREGVGEKHDRKKRDVVKRGEEELERKTKEHLGKIKTEEEGRNEKIEKMKTEEREGRNKEQEKTKTQEDRMNKEVDELKKKEEESKNRQEVERIRPEEERQEKEEKMNKEPEEVKYQEEEENKGGVEKMEEEREGEKEEVEMKNVEEERESILENGWRENKEEEEKREKENVMVDEEVRLRTKKEEEERDGSGIKDEGVRQEMEEQNRKEEERDGSGIKDEGRQETEEENRKEEEPKGKDQKEMEDEGRTEEKTEMEEAAPVSDESCREEGNVNHHENKNETEEEDGEVREETNVKTHQRFSDDTEAQGDQLDQLDQEVEVEKHLPTTEAQDLGLMVGDGPATPSTTESVSRTFCFPDDTEHKRLAWMEDCVSWSKVSVLNRRKQRGSGPRGRRPRRAGDAGTLTPLPPHALLKDTGWRTLKEVTTVSLRDVSGRNISILAQCRSLRSLTLRRCGLKALEDLHQLPELCYVDAQENEISFVDCENMTCLRVLRLAHNKLTSIHGLRGTENLDVLDLSYNSISRIAGLESAGRLQRLSVDHNQLISTKGLRLVSTLLHLSCSHNHLARVEGLDNCVLLSTLDLRSNSLSQPPALNNHVLLRELRLDDNSISSLRELAACWLPIMQHLSVAQNRITHLPCMSDFVSLENLDLHFNCLSELNNVCQSLQRCRFLREVHLVGNPLTQERGWRSSLHKAVSSLRSSDGQESASLLSPPAVQQLSSSSGGFLTLCQLQLQQIHDLHQRYSRQLSGASSSVDAVHISCQHHTEALQLAEQHRLAHECGHTSVPDPRDPTVPPVQDSSAEEPTESPPVDSPPRCWTSEMCSTQKLFDAIMMRPVMKADTSTSHSLAEEKKTFTSKLQVTRVSHHRDLRLRTVAAVMIQQWWRKRKQKSGNMSSPPAAEQGGGGQEPVSGPVSADRRVVSPDDAATVIQASWRGFSLRRRLTSALGAVTCPDAGHDDTFEEVDMDEFVFDEAALDQDWLLSLSEDSASTERLESPQLLPMEPLEPCPGPPQDIRPPSMLQRPKQAWVTGEHVDSSPGTSNSDLKTKRPASASLINGLSERSERILEEWGFTDSHTALLMLKRAQKMKPKKQQQQQKLKDPNVRLALFRSCAYQLGPVETRQRPQPQNRYQLQVCEVELELPQAEKSESERMSLQPRDDQGDGKTQSSHFLPEISSNLLRGGRVQHVADPGHAQRLHHASSSSLSAQACVVNSRPRRRSLDHERKDVPAPKRVTSAPTSKERISFRDKPVQLSVGWGGGKKRGK